MRLLDENDVYALFAPNGTARLHVADIDALLRVDAVEVEHGRWIDQSFAMNGGVVRFCTCSECRHEMAFETNYCPNCGAKMDLEG